MQDFAEELETYLAGHLTLEQFRMITQRRLQEGGGTRAAILKILATAVAEGKLDEDTFRAVQVIDEDQTRIAVRPNQGAVDPTLANTVPLFGQSSGIAASTVVSNDSTSIRQPTGTITTKSLQDPSSLLTEPTQELELGAIIKERFVLKEILGVGGMGRVFKALDLRKVEANDKEPFIALKVLSREFRDNPMALIALQRETKRAQTLSHPNIIHVYDFDREGQNVYMSMEYLTGKPLSHYIRDIPETGSRFKQLWPIIEAMALALGHAHHKGVVHSDFKPGNVFINNEGEVKVLDFGIACAVSRPGSQGEDATIFNARDLGAMTPAYASLEQSQGLPPDPRDDIYALACVTYELLSGKHPFGRLPAEKALELKLQPQPLPNLKGRAWKGLLHALALKQNERTSSIDAFLRELRPRTHWYYALAATLIFLLGLTGTNLYFTVYAPKPLQEPPIAIEFTAEQKQKIKDLLELAAIHFDVGYLTAPTGSNALWAYREVLKVDPYNKDALEGIKKIANALEQQAWEAYEKGDRIGSMEKVQEGLEADAGHQGLLQLKAKLKN